MMAQPIKTLELHYPMIQFLITGLIHDSRHVGFHILSCKLAMCYAGGSNIEKKKELNCGKSAQRNIEVTLQKVHFSI